MKQYNGEKAIISLTSWKARINTVSKTLYSLIQQCPGFHIVLCLSEEEFPQKEKALPENLMLFVENDLIEILWVYKNYKSFKKVLFTMDKYRDVPVISADDDCIYNCNYAEKLYQEWLKHKNCVVTSCRHFVFNYMLIPNGCFALYPPYTLLGSDKLLTNEIIATNNDDVFYGYILHKKNINFSFINIKYPTFHDEIEALGKTGKYTSNISVLHLFQKILG